MIINKIYNFVILKNFSCKKRGTQPHKSAQEDPFKKFIELYNAQRTIIKRYLGSLRPKIFGSIDVTIPHAKSHPKARHKTMHKNYIDIHNR